MAGITILGLGPGNPMQLSLEAWEVLKNAEEIWLRTEKHPTIIAFPPSLKNVHSFDHLYETSDSFTCVYSEIIKEVIRLGKRKQGVIYAVPGDPFIAETTSPQIASRARELGIELRIVSGMSFLEPTFAALGIDPFPQTTLMDAMELSQLLLPPFPIDKPVLITQIYSQLIAAEVKATLNSFYSDEQEVILIHAAGTEEQLIEKIPLYLIDRSSNIGLMTNLFVPVIDSGVSYETFQEVIARLRGPDGCPWDRKQTHKTLTQNLIEEAYEVIEAMEEDDPSQMAEEFGDLLLQITLNAQIGFENGEFNMIDILTGIHDKLIRRHPHVFGDMKTEDISNVLETWEKIKASERNKSDKLEQGLLTGIPSALPALIQAQEIQERAARVGFDWENIEGVIEKIVEEVKEISEVKNQDELEGELGDLLFAIVNYSRWKETSAEAALRRTNKKFKNRFSYIERMVNNKGKEISAMSLDELEEIWQEAKKTYQG